MKAGQGAQFQGSKDSAMTIMHDSEPEHEASSEHTTARAGRMFARYSQRLPRNITRNHQGRRVSRDNVLGRR
jgi:hypothetical protein